IMARGSLLKGPNYVHPERESAVGSRNSLYRDNRNEYSESKLIVDEEVDKILNHVSAKLPPEVLEKLHVGGTVKELLHNYYNQSYHNMYNRYIVTVEDEMAKKFRLLIDKDEANNLNKYTPRDIPFLLDTVGEEGKFNTTAVENSVANIFGHLQGHLQKGVFDLEDKTRKLLSGKTAVGGFLRGQFANSVVKCSFSDNFLKPETVTDINVVINVPESDLQRPIYHYQAKTETIVKDVVSEHILTVINREIDKINAELEDSRQERLNEGKSIFEKVKKLDDHFGFGEQSADSPQFKHIAKKFIDAIKGLDAQAEHAEYDPLDTRENVIKIIDDENIRDSGFNDAVNKLVGILDISALGYQHIENYKNCRKVDIREYEDKNTPALPDEHYSLTLEYLDDMQLRELRTAYCQQMEEFEAEAIKLFKVFEKIHAAVKQEKGILDYEDVAEEILSQVRGNKKKAKTAEAEELPRAELWDEITFIHPEKNEIEKLNDTFVEQRKHLSIRYKYLRQRIIDLYENENPPERIIMEQRLDFLEQETTSFCQRYNPFQVFPGLFLEVNLASIKRRESTASGLGNVLTQFIKEMSHEVPDYSLMEYHNKKDNHETDADRFASAV
ncbi:cytochrome C oxidase subunit II, partial [bacterium]|nr:cytochrome C oxidase subunit II [bacterium]